MRWARQAGRTGGWKEPIGWLVGAPPVLGLVVVVAVASSGSPAWAPVGEPGRDRWAVLELVLAVTGAVLIAALAVVRVAHPRVLGRAGAVPQRVSLLRALPFVSVALTVIALVAIARTDPGRAPHTEAAWERIGESRPPSAWGIVDDRVSPVVPGGGTEDAEQELEEGPGPRRHSFLFSLLFSVAAAVLVWLLIRARNRGREGPASEGELADAEQAAVRDTVAGTIEAMIADPDPRTAIIGAYARLLEGLAVAGGGRRPHEAPMEHLRRVLTILRVRPEPLRTLTELFEVARFSTHRVTPAHRGRALAALRAVAVELAATPMAGAGTAVQSAIGAGSTSGVAGGSTTPDRSGSREAAR